MTDKDGDWEPVTSKEAAVFILLAVIPWLVIASLFVLWITQ